MDRGVQSASSPLSRQLDSAPSVSSSRSSFSTPLKPESPRSRTIPTFEMKIVTPKKAKQCNCKNSQCLKMYCECFTTKTYCKGCNCVNCHNVENDPARKDAIETLLDRRPNAFRPKIDSSPQAAHDKENAGESPLLARHNKGCNCKKSGCLKKYCECFQAGILCSENCKCLDCKNFEGSEDRKLLFNVDRGNNLTYIQKTENAAISGATGSSGFFSLENRKRKSHHLLFGAAVNSQPFHGNGQASQVNHLTGAQLSSSFTGIPLAHAIIPSPQSKLTYRSPLADIIQPETVKDVCVSLVVASAEKAKAFSEKSHEEKVPEGPSRTESSFASSRNVEDEIEQKHNAKESSADDSSSGPHSPKSSIEELGSESADAQISRRPLSPGTLALMCDEQDTMFIKSPNSCTSEILSESQKMTVVYAEQERCILIKFRDTLLNLANCARIKGEKQSRSIKPLSSNHHGSVVNARSQFSDEEPTCLVNAIPAFTNNHMQNNAMYPIHGRTKS